MIRVKEVFPYTWTTRAFSYPTALRGGTITIEKTTDSEVAQISINTCAYMLIKDITTNTDSWKLAKTLGMDAGEDLVNTMTDFIVLTPGMELEVYNYSSSGTDDVGNVDSTTAVRASLGVNRNGKVCAKQTEGEGSVEYFKLMENNIATTGFIKIKCVAISG